MQTPLTTSDRRALLLGAGFTVRLNSNGAIPAEEDFWILEEPTKNTWPFTSEQAALGSIEIDANFCEEHLKRWARGLSKKEKAVFSNILYDLIKPNKGEAVPICEFWLRVTPDLLCRAFLLYMKENKR